MVSAIFIIAVGLGAAFLLGLLKSAQKDLAFLVTIAALAFMSWVALDWTVALTRGTAAPTTILTAGSQPPFAINLYIGTAEAWLLTVINVTGLLSAFYMYDALRRLGIADVDEEGRLLGKAMVVGATGAIGSVCARLLAMACDELWMVSPEAAKLLALKADIESENPRAKIFVAATPDDALPDMDAIVTATSGAGKRVLDIMQVKPGAVITDVARPLDLSAEDVAKRPDVLVVESGEILLPGDVHMKNIGLPPGVAYACLAETIVLALEGRYETFTIGRNIEWPKVKEIYRLGLKHGMKLATISGVNGVYSDEDLERVRELALAKRAEMADA